MARTSITTDTERNHMRAAVALASIAAALAENGNPARLFDLQERARSAAKALPEAKQKKLLASIAEAVPTDDTAEPEGDCEEKPEATGELLTAEDRRVIAERRARFGW